jgi:site-specific recombinase XerD
MPLSEAIQAFLFAKEIQGLSPNTIRNYRLTLARFRSFFDASDPELLTITGFNIQAFLHSLQSKAPESSSTIPRKLKPLSPKSIRNVHGTLSSLWEWAIEENLVAKNVVRTVKPPNPQMPTIKPFHESDVRALLRQVGQGSTSEIRYRDRAIILFLLDTGVRASELCNLRLANIDLKQGSALVRGKGRLDQGVGRQRMVFMGGRVQRAIHRYLLERKAEEPEAWLFVTRDGRQLTRDVLGRRLRRLGKRAGVLPCGPHKFRHTFAIFYLRNGGDVFTLQRLLGHSSLDMVQRYLAIAQADVEAAHRKAGPVDNWGL